MDRQKARVVLDGIDEAVRGVAEKHGLVLAKRTGSYVSSTLEPGRLIVRLEFSEAASKEDAEREAFCAIAPLHGLTPLDWGREFAAMGRTFRLVGIRPRSRRAPLIGEEVGVPDPKRYAFATWAYKQATGQAQHG